MEAFTAQTWRIQRSAQIEYLQVFAGKLGLKKAGALKPLTTSKWENIGNSHRAPTQVSLAEGLKS